MDVDGKRGKGRLKKKWLNVIESDIRISSIDA